MAKRKKKIEFENIELEPVETLEFQTDSESVETFEKSVENSVETLADEVSEPVKTSKYKVGNIVVIKGLPYVVRGFNNGMYTLMNFNKNVIEIPETDL